MRGQWTSVHDGYLDERVACMCTGATIHLLYGVFCWLWFSFSFKGKSNAAVSFAGCIGLALAVSQRGSLRIATFAGILFVFKT